LNHYLVFDVKKKVIPPVFSHVSAILHYNIQIRQFFFIL